MQTLQSGSFTPTAAPPPDCSVSVIGVHDHGRPGSALQLVDDYYRMPEVTSAALTIDTMDSKLTAWSLDTYYVSNPLVRHLIALMGSGLIDRPPTVSTAPLVFL